MYALVSALLLSLFLNALTAQNKQLTPGDAAWLNRDLFPESIQQLQWRGNADVYTFVDNNSLISKEAKKNDRADTLMNVDGLNSLLVAAGADSTKRLPESIGWKTKLPGFFYKSTLYHLDAEVSTLKKITELPENAANQDVHTPSLNVAYTIDNNLFLAQGEKHIQLTNEPEGVVSGQAVHRNEFGISKGTFLVRNRRQTGVLSNGRTHGKQLSYCQYKNAYSYT